MKQVYAKVFSYSYMNVNIGVLLAHMCFENKEFSAKMGKLILVGINKSNADEIRPYLDALLQYLSIQDSFRQ